MKSPICRTFGELEWRGHLVLVVPPNVCPDERLAVQPHPQLLIVAVRHIDGEGRLKETGVTTRDGRKGKYIFSNSDFWNTNFFKKN